MEMAASSFKLWANATEGRKAISYQQHQPGARRADIRGHSALCHLRKFNINPRLITAQQVVQSKGAG
jgi:hypothetical protein